MTPGVRARTFGLAPSARRANVTTAPSVRLSCQPVLMAARQDAPQIRGQPALRWRSPLTHSDGMNGKPLLKQECPLAFVVLAWSMYIGGAGLLLILQQWFLAGTWIVVAPAAMWAYIRWFPAISPWMGYGHIDDVPAVPRLSAATVTFYSALGCPFCPIVKRRLHDLQTTMRFALREVDVTGRPDILTRKGIWSVPVVEVGDRRLVGHATSERLGAFIAGPADPSTAAAPQLVSLTPGRD